MEEFQTPFVATDPSITRIVDEEETAANGEMFKDARLQERIFDQIHAREFNLEDDFRTAEVGSVLSADSYRDASFQRIDDSDVSEEGTKTARMQAPIAAHVESFVDSVEEATLQGGSFERVSDDEEAEQTETVVTRRDKKESGASSAGTRARGEIVASGRKKPGDSEACSEQEH